MTDHELFREWAGPYVLGALDSDERAEFEIHLASCRSCQTEIITLSPLPGLLRNAEPMLDPEEPAASTGSSAIQLLQRDRLSYERRIRR